jgi:hypothetical protein
MRERKKRFFARKKTAILTGKCIKKKSAGRYSVPALKTCTEYPIFYALSNDVIFINSKRHRKFQVS